MFDAGRKCDEYDVCCGYLPYLPEYRSYLYLIRSK